METKKAIEATTQKAAEEGVGLLRKVKLENEALQANVQQLKLENVTLSFAKAKAEEEGIWLNLDLDQNQADFIKEKRTLRQLIGNK